MKTLHIAPGDSAGGSLIQAIRDAGRDDEVLRFRDDLSCGPIDTDEPAARAIWWNQFYEMPEVDTALAEFWQCVAATEDQLVVWFGRHYARELAFFLAWADRLGQRLYQIIDMTGRRFPFAARDGSPALSQPAQAVAITQPYALRSLLGTERPITAQERDESAQCWRRLRSENAPFRVVTEAGLVSAPVDTFDHLLLEQATAMWQSEARLIGNTMGWEPYFQVGDLMLKTRVVALVEAGKLLAEGDPWDAAFGCQAEGKRSVGRSDGQPDGSGRGPRRPGKAVRAGCRGFPQRAAGRAGVSKRSGLPPRSGVQPGHEDAAHRGWRFCQRFADPRDPRCRPG